MPLDINPTNQIRIANMTDTGSGSKTPYIDSASAVDDYTAQEIMANSLHGIHGLPYQFMDTVDRRLTDTEIGRKYGEKIVSKLPLLFLTPGKQQFMSEFSSDEQRSIIDALISKTEVDPNNLINKYGKYYTFKHDYATYYQYVNTMCWVVAKFLGLENVVMPIGDNGKNSSYEKTLGGTDWSKATNSAFKTFFSNSENVVFYLDGLTSVSESFSNSTTESSLASSVNGLTDQAKEIQFILGSGNSSIANLVNDMGDVASSITSSLSGVVTNLAGGILGGLTGSGVNTILSGGKIVFPELWQDSGFDRSYSLDIKLRSPDHDSLSIYMNILVPYIHLLALVLPRGLDGTTDSSHIDPNGYTSPFLVRAYCKGLFNIDQGIITSLSANKGAECCWNDDGLPTQIDISIEIKDLYSVLFMSNLGNHLLPHNVIKGVAGVVTNTSMLDFLANMSGLNLGLDEIGRRTKMFNYLTMRNYTSLPSRKWTAFDQKMSDLMGRLYEIF